MEVTLAGNNTQLQKEHSATSESTQMEVSKDLGHTKVLEKSSSFQSDERSMVVEESSTQSMEATHSVQQSFSSSVTAEKKVSKSVMSSSSSFEASEGFGIPKLDPTQTYETNTSLDAYRTAVEVDPGPILSPEQQSKQQESTVTEQPKTFEPESKPEPVKAKTPPKFSPEIEEGKIKNTLKEIISEIDHYVEKNDDTLKESCVTRSEMKESSSSIIENSSGSDLSYENVAKFANMNVTSEEHKPEIRTHQDMLVARLPSCVFSSKSDRPLSLPTENLMQLLKSVQIAQELNQVFKSEETETKVRRNEIFQIV